MQRLYLGEREISGYRRRQPASAHCRDAGVFYVADHNIGFHNESVEHVVDAHRRVVRSVRALFIGKNAGIEICFRQLSRILFRIFSVRLSTIIHLLKLLQDDVQMHSSDSRASPISTAVRIICR